MKILVIGGGGREHAIVWKFAQSERVETVYCAPGNPGIAATPKAVCVDVPVGGDFADIRRFAKENGLIFLETSAKTSFNVEQAFL